MIGHRLHPLAVPMAVSPLGASGAVRTMDEVGADAETVAFAGYHVPSLACATDENRSGVEGAGRRDANSQQWTHLKHEALAEDDSDANGTDGRVRERAHRVWFHDHERTIVPGPDARERHGCRERASWAAARDSRGVARSRVGSREAIHGRERSGGSAASN